MTPSQTWLTWAIAALATLGVIVRPFRWPEAIWSVSGAALLVALGLLPAAASLRAVAKGGDVCFFLIGMMLLAELARTTGLFDWLAAVATKRARGSAPRLFLLIYVVGTVVTTFLSNDATAVVLTPAVAAAVKKAKVADPLPYLLICAFIANAASFVLPISNPANLVIYGANMPSLWQWLPRFALPSVASIGATYGVLRFTQRTSLRQPIETRVSVPTMTPEGKMAALGIGATALLLLLASTFGMQLGLPTLVAGVVMTTTLGLRNKKSLGVVLTSISWSVLPLVAGLFVLVEGLETTGLVRILSLHLRRAAEHSDIGAAWAAGTLCALGCNLTNNLPAGLVAGSVVGAAQVSERVARAMLIGIDVGPNLSVTGSLATILWLTALRREGLTVGAGAFLKLGVLVMTPALLLALGVSLLDR